MAKLELETWADVDIWQATTYDGAYRASGLNPLDAAMKLLEELERRLVELGSQSPTAS